MGTTTKDNYKIIGVDISAFTAGNHLCDKTYVVPYSYDETYIPQIKKIISNYSILLKATSIL